MNSKITDIVAANFMLARLSVSRFGASKKDREITDQVALDNDVIDKRMIGATKKLLSGGKFAELNSFLGGIRDGWYYKKTAAFCDNADKQKRGDRLVAITRVPEFDTEFRAFEKEFNTLRADMVAEYSDAKLLAQHALGKAYKESDYPSESELSAKYDLTLKILPVPSISQYAQLPADLAEEYARQVSAEQIASLKTAQGEALENARGHFKKIQAQLEKRLDSSNKDARLHDSLIENGKLVASLVRDMAAGDPRMIAIADKMESDCLVADKGIWKDSETAAVKSKDSARQIVAAIDSIATVNDTTASAIDSAIDFY